MANVFNAAKAAPVLTAGVLLGLRPYADLEALARANNADAIKLPADYKGKAPQGELPNFVSQRSLPEWASEKASSRYRARPPRGNRNAKPKVAVRPGMTEAQRQAFYARNGGAFQQPSGTGVKTGGGIKTNDPAAQRELRSAMKGSGGGGKKKQG